MEEKAVGEHPDSVTNAGDADRIEDSDQIGVQERFSTEYPRLAGMVPGSENAKILPQCLRINHCTWTDGRKVSTSATTEVAVM
ncbi:MAG: hypothetical protein ACRDSF_23280, partial [Pseudonocardiaceae bacterium]